MMRVRIGEFVAAVCVVAWGVAQVWAAPGAIGVSCCCVLVFCLLWCDAAQGEVGRRVLYQWTQAAVSRSTSPIAPGAGELRPETWTHLIVAVMRLVGGPDLGILPGSGP